MSAIQRYDWKDAVKIACFNWTNTWKYESGISIEKKRKKKSFNGREQKYRRQGRKPSALDAASVERVLRYRCIE